MIFHPWFESKEVELAAIFHRVSNKSLRPCAILPLERAVGRRAFQPGGQGTLGPNWAYLCVLMTGWRKNLGAAFIQGSSEFFELWLKARKVNRGHSLLWRWQTSRFPWGGSSCMRVVRSVLPSSGPRDARRQLPLTWLCPVSHCTTASCSPHALTKSQEV